MASITQNVLNIRAAILGEEVRESIASGIENINAEVVNTTERQKLVEDKQAAVEVRQDLNDANEIIRQNNETGREDVEDSRVTDFGVIKKDYESYKKVMIAESNVAALQNGININASQLADISNLQIKCGKEYPAQTYPNQIFYKIV